MKTALHVNFGDGKGKTTCAMGLACRALGQGYKVLIAQFMKKKNSGELVTFKKLPNATVIAMPEIKKFSFNMNEEEKLQTKEEQTQGLYDLCKQIEEIKPQLMILDELGITAYNNFITLENMNLLIDTGLKYGEVVVTGRNVPPSLIERADYVTEMKKHKHPFDEGLSARKGIEW